MIRGDAVAENGEGAAADDVAQGRRHERHVLEERRIPDVGRIRIPREAIAGRHLQLLPALVALEDVRVLLLELIGPDRREHRLLNLALARPDVAEIHGPSVLAGPERLRRQIERHRAGEGIGDDERRRRQVVCADLLLHAALEVAVAAEHRCHDETSRIHFRRHIVGQRTAVADAGRAPVADEIEPELIEVFVESGLLQVFGHHFRPGRQARFDPRLLRQTFFDRLLRDQSGAEHHARVRRVRAARDCRDHHRAVIDGGCRRSRDCRATAGSGFPRDHHARQRLGKTLLRAFQRDAVLRPLRSSQAWLDSREVQFDRFRVGRIGGVRLPEQALRLCVGFNQLDSSGIARCEAQIIERHRVDRKHRDRCAVLGTHVAERRPVGQREVLEPGTVELDELADDALLAQALGNREHEIGGGRPFGQAARQLHAEHRWNQHRRRLAEHRGFGFDPAYAPPDHAETVDHRRVRIGPDEGVGKRQRASVDIGGHHDAGEIFEIDLVHDSCVWRNHPEIPECVLTPAEKRVAFPVPRELELSVQRKRVGAAEIIHLHRVVDDELHRLQRVHPVGIAAEPDDAIPHRGQIDDARNSGKVLQQHARGHERDLALRRALHVPARQRLDIGRLHEAAVLVAKQIFEKDFQRVRQARDLGEA